VEVPLQRVVERDALASQALAMVDQQPQIELAALQLRRWQGVHAFTQYGPSDRDGVDAVGLSARASAAPRVGHQLRRHAHHALAAGDQEPLQAARDMPAVLQRPHPLAAECARPSDERGKALGADLDRLLAHQLTGRRGDRGDRVRALVGVRPEHDH
jgi:hypothetical protein